jgi:aryl-alcohol dehydrogenase-like predicted oxidoreductase
VAVSNLCLGAMMFGEWGTKDHDESIRIIHRALDAGITFIDTADVYSSGESEEIVGKALADGKRTDVFLATKVGFPVGDDPHQRGASRRRIIRGVEDSLRRLNTDWIDLYQIHRPDPNTDTDETLAALTDLVRDGKIRYFGHSTFATSQIVQAQWTARDRGHLPFAASSRPTPSSPATSSTTCCRPASSTDWALSPTARSPAAGCPGATAKTPKRGARPPRLAPPIASI